MQWPNRIGVSAYRRIGEGVGAYRRLGVLVRRRRSLLLEIGTSGTGGVARGLIAGKPTRPYAGTSLPRADKWQWRLTQCVCSTFKKCYELR
jgi:hypothetical protein